MSATNLASIVRLMGWNETAAELELERAAQHLETARDQGRRIEGHLVNSANGLNRLTQVQEAFSATQYNVRSQLIDQGLNALRQQRVLIVEAGAAVDQARKAVLDAKRRLDLVKQISERRRRAAEAEMHKRAELENGDLWLSRWSAVS